MHCIKCGKQLPDDSRFCDACGAQLIYDEVSEEDHSRKEKVKKEKKPLTKKAKVIITAVCIVLILALASGGYYYSYSKGVAYATNADVVNAKKCLLFPQITKQHDPNLMKLLDAEELLAAGDYEEAEQAFRDLIPYRNSAQFVNETMYQHALALEAEEKYQESLDILNRLAAVDYRDSQAKIREDWQNLALSESYKEDYYPSLRTLAAAKKAGIEFDSGVKQTIQSRAYEAAVKEFRRFSGSETSGYGIAYILFQELGNYKRSSDYLFLCKYDLSYDYSPSDIDRLISLIGFENAGRVIFSSTAPALDFLGEDTWSGTCGTMRFYSDGDSTYGDWSITGVPNDSWSFLYGKFYVGDMAQFSIEALSRDKVQIKILSSGRTYTLTR